jgi:hypothetical protein
MGISFSSSLFGLAGSLILGFLDLQSSQAQNRFYTDLEDWLASTVRHYSGESGDGTTHIPAASVELRDVLERLRTTLQDLSGSSGGVGAAANRSTATAMANLADAIQGLVQHMRTEQQMIREWVDGQGEQNREIRRLLEVIARQPENN